MIFRQRAQPVLKQGLACKQECRGWRGLRRKSRSETSCRWSDRSGPTAYNETDAAPRTSETLTRLSFLRSLAAVRGRSCASPRSSGGGGGTPEPSLRLHHFAGGRRGSERCAPRRRVTQRARLPAPGRPRPSAGSLGAGLVPDGSVIAPCFCAGRAGPARRSATSLFRGLRAGPGRACQSTGPCTLVAVRGELPRCCAACTPRREPTGCPDGRAGLVAAHAAAWSNPHTHRG